MCEKFTWRHDTWDELRECYNCGYYNTLECPDISNQTLPNDTSNISEDDTIDPKVFTSFFANDDEMPF